MFHGAPSAGLCDEQITFFNATGLKRVGPGGGDDTEDITVHAVSLAAVPTWLAERQQTGAVIDVKIFAALYFLGRSGSA
jgi:ADP-ribose pyrophosphatase